MLYRAQNVKRHPLAACRVAVCGALLLTSTFATVTVARQGQASPGDARTAVAKAFFEALASGDADRFESMARERFAPVMLERRTPADRRQLVERVKGDFGTLTLAGIRNLNDEQITLQLEGSTGLQGRVELRLAPEPPYRITGMGIEVGGDEEQTTLPPPPINSGMSRADLEKALDAYLAARAASDAFAGVVAIARDGEMLFEKAYGLADREARVAASSKTRYNVASIGKAFTKAAIGQLMSQGRLALTDTLGRWLPDYPNDKAKKATIDQLLNHQAGIADFFGPEFDAAPKSGFASNADYYRLVSAQPLLFEPGTNRRYCNGCYVVLGEIIAKASGERYEDYIARHVFAPAGMARAGFLRADTPNQDLAQQYSTQLRESKGALRNAREAHGVAGSAAGGCYATAADLLAFDKALREGKLLDAKMTAWFLGSDPAPAGQRARGGLGIAGGAPGTNALLDTDEHWAVAIVTNLDPPAAGAVGQAIKRQLSR